MQGLTLESTKEDIEAYAAEVMTEIKKDRAGETKPDSQIISEHADNKTPSAAESSDDSDLEKQVEDSEAESEVEWLTDDVKAEAAAFGIDESELSDFASREELDRALRLFDKSALEAGRKAMAESETQARNEKGQFAKKPKSDEQPKEKPVVSSYEVSLNKELYDEEVIGEFTKLRDYYESRLEQYESRFEALEGHFQEVTEKAATERFDNLVDSLDMPDLFGKTGQESQQEIQRREDLLVALKAQMIGLERLGRPSEMNQNLINRVARMVFADEFSKKELKQRTRSISKQSNRRQGGGQTRPNLPSEDPREAADRRFRELSRD